MNVEAARKNLLEIKRVFDECKVRFWLRGGVLLGAVREKRLLPWDNDMDLRILAGDWGDGLLKKFETAGFRCREHRRYLNTIAKLTLKKRGISTDLGLEYYYPPEHVYFVLPSRAYWRGPKVVTPAKFYEKECFTDFLGEVFPVPGPPEEFLVFIFGNNWKTPMRKRPWLSHYRPVSLEKYLKWLSEHLEEEPE